MLSVIFWYVYFDLLILIVLCFLPGLQQSINNPLHVEEVQVVNEPTGSVTKPATANKVGFIFITNLKVQKRFSFSNKWGVSF